MRSLASVMQEDTFDPSRSTSAERAEEHALVARLRAGDPHAIAELFTTYANRLTRFAFYLVGSRDTAEDVVQYVFVKLWERRASLHADSHLRAYLFRAVRNRALNEQSVENTRDRYILNVRDQADTGLVPSAVPSHEDRIVTDTTIQAAVDQLPERRRIALRLRMEEEMTHNEIAEVLGISPMAAQSLVARAVAEIRSLLWEK